MKKHLLLLSFMITLLFQTTLWATTVPSPLADTTWLKDNINKVVVLDVRKDTKSFTKQPVFKTNKKTKKKKLVRVGGHIPGSVLVPYKQVRSKKVIDGKKVSKMLPGKKAFEKILQNAGINKGDAVVITTKGQNNGDMTIATRFYWQMKYYGFSNMAILDGGVASWITSGHTVSSKSKKVSKGNWTSSTLNPAVLASSSDVQKAIKSKTQLIDNRNISQYLGTWKKSYVYAKGHIPTAKNYPTEILTSTKIPAKFLPVKSLKTLNKALGIDSNAPTITYCNSGHLATGSWFVMSELMGNKNVKMYDGSMHQWTLEKRPVKSMVVE